MRVVDAEQSINRRGVIERAVVLADDRRAFAVGLADGVSHRRPCTAEADGVARCVVVSACSAVDARSAAELASTDHERRIEQPALRQVFEQRRPRLVERREQRLFQADEVLDVRVPTVEADGHEADTRLDQSPSQQRRLPLAIAAVPIANGIRFGLQIEGFLCSGRRDEVERLPIKLTAIEHRAAIRRRVRRFHGRLNLSLPAVQSIEHSAATHRSIEADFVRDADIFDAEILGVRVRLDREWIVF